MENLIHFDMKELIATVGYIGIIGIIYAESGLLIGFFLPGDSLLFTAGVIAGSSKLQDTLGIELQYPILAVGCGLAAILGDSTGYWFGSRVGRRLFERPDTMFFKKKYLYQAEHLYEKHGGKIIVIARFIPIVRTFAPIVAGIGTMHYRRFLSYNIVGGLLWAVGVTTAGYIFGEKADGYITPIAIGIIIVSVMPMVIHVLMDYLKGRRARQQGILPVEADASSDIH